MFPTLVLDPWVLMTADGYCPLLLHAISFWLFLYILPVGPHIWHPLLLHFCS